MISAIILRLVMVGVSLFAIGLAAHTLYLYEQVQRGRVERRRARDMLTSHVWRVTGATVGYVAAANFEVLEHMTSPITWRPPVYIVLGILLIDATWRIHSFELRELHSARERSHRDE